jgi:metal-responsive CopG/Arc/MetJ family transcriptional regulator
MSKRINIVLPDQTAAVLDRVTTKGNRSRFIDRAVRRLVETEGKANLRSRLKEEAIANSDRDLAIAAEWFPLEEETATAAKAGPLTKHRKRA